MALVDHFIHSLSLRRQFLYSFPEYCAPHTAFYLINHPEGISIDTSLFQVVLSKGKFRVWYELIGLHKIEESECAPTQWINEWVIFIFNASPLRLSSSFFSLSLFLTSSTVSLCNSHSLYLRFGGIVGSDGIKFKMMWKRNV